MLLFIHFIDRFLLLAPTRAFWKHDFTKNNIREAQVKFTVYANINAEQWVRRLVDPQHGTKDGEY